MTVTGLGRSNDDEKWSDSEEEMIWAEGYSAYSTDRRYLIGNVGAGKGGITGTNIQDPGKGPEI